MSKDVCLYDNKVRICLPDEFEDREDVEQFYSSGKPDFLFKGRETNAVLSVSKVENISPKSSLEERINGYFNLYRTIIPNFDHYKIAKKVTKSGTEIAAFHYTSTSRERVLYNLFALTFVDNQDFIFLLHCDLEKIGACGIKFMNILSSITMIK